MDSNARQYKETLKKAADRINELNNQLNQKEQKDEIAVIGYSCRFPGGANNTQQFWEMLSGGKDAVTEINDNRISIDHCYSHDRNQPGKTYTKSAALLDFNYKEFDFTHFEISAEESESIDPLHKLLLEVSWEALENAGLNPRLLRGSRTGVFIASYMGEYSKENFFSGDVKDINQYVLLGMVPSAASGRLSYFYDFTGPALTCDTACSSSLIALNAAVESLRSGQCSMAIVGGASLILIPETFISISKLQGLSSDGRCKAFDASADGFGRGEGCGILILKKYKDAIRDNNDVHALVKSVCVGQDGRSNGIAAPNGLSQEYIMHNALKMSGLSVNDIDYIEAHGTGTVLGDVIETQSIATVYKKKEKKMLIGTVKSNIGHLEAAAGVAGIIKVLLSMKHGKMPASLHFKEPNPNINWGKIQVVDQLIDWDHPDGKRSAGVSAFGITGTIAHAIFQEAKTEKTDLPELPYSIITLSAKGRETLRETIKSLEAFIKNSKEPMQNIGYTSNIIRSSLEHRFSINAETREVALKTISDCLNNDDKYLFHTSQVKSYEKQNIAFLFTGQGSIYTGVAKQIYETSVLFKQALDLCDEKFREILGFSIIHSIYEGSLQRPIISQSAIFSIEYALTRVWNSLGIFPDVVIGHSIGEYTAACFAGLLSLDDAVKMIVERAKLMESVEIEGKMVGVLTNNQIVENIIRESGCHNVSIAAVNAPQNVTISGVSQEVDKVISLIQSKERVFINKLNISHPFHSVVMKQYEALYHEAIGEIRFSPLNTKVISSMTGKLEDVDILGNKRYWTEHLSHTVYYQKAIEEAEKLGVTVFIEIGGDATLTGLAEQCLYHSQSLFLPSLRKGVNNYLNLSALYS